MEYTYDGNGNLTSDANKGISLIEYDDMNMPHRIQFTNGNKIEYVYTAEGKKLRTIYYTASTEQKDSTEYLLGGLLTKKNNNLDKYLYDGGYYSFDNNTPTCHYYNRDHLGNIREVIAENGTVEQVTHYYPFGTPYSDSSVTNPAFQPYKYNGKEFDAMHGLHTYDYGARQYDPLLVVWHGVDPLCEKDYRTGTSVYCRNNPLRFVDLFGLKAYDAEDAEENWEKFDPQEDEIVLNELYVVGHNRQETGIYNGITSFWDAFSIHAPSNGDWIGAASYAGEHAEDYYTTLSTSEKSKYTYDALKFARKKFGWKYKGRNADIYKRTIPRFLKNANKILGRGNVLYTAWNNFKDVKAKGKFTIGNGVDIGVTTLTTIGVFGTMGVTIPAIGLGYLGTDVLLEVTTGKGVREHIDEQLDNIELNTGF